MPAAERKIPPTMTVDEFVAWDDGHGGKYELVDGVLRAMSPASATHGALQANVAMLIGSHLVPTPCRIFTEPAVETRIRARQNLRIPDLGVSCSPVASGQVALPDPILLIEIMSPGNQDDTWSNVWTYTSIPSVKEILIVQSTRIEALLLTRQPDGAWPADPLLIGPDDTLVLASIELSVPLRTVYAKTYLAP